MDKPSIIFMGTPSFAVPTLRSLHEAGYPIRGVYSQPPRPVGRGYKTQLSPVHYYALEKEFVVLTPSSLKTTEVQEEFKALKADLIVVVAYGLILPSAILKACPYGAFNVHASLLPRWRGAAPIQRAILAGDSKTGVTIMQMEQGLDTGPMILKEEVTISTHTTSQLLHDQLSEVGARLIHPALQGFLSGDLTPISQPAESISYAEKITKTEGKLDWSMNAQHLEQQIRAFYPWPGSFFTWEGQPIKVLKGSVEALPFPKAQPGKILDNALLIACGTHALRLLELQRPGKSAMKALEFLNGVPMSAGMMLSD